MDFPNTKMWMIRAERDGAMIEHFLNEGIASLGWGEVGPIYPTDTKENVRRRLDESYRYDKVGARPNIVGMLRRFSCDVHVGDAFVTVDPQRRLYHVGLVRSDAEIGTHLWLNPATGNVSDEKGYVRKVDWVRAIPWISLSLTARRTLNGQLSHFRIRTEVSEEIRRLCA